MIETKSAYISKLDVDTLKVVFKPNAVLFNEEYEEFYAHYQTLSGKDAGIKFLVIIQDGFKMNEHYISFFKKKYRIDFKKAEAFIILNHASKMFFKVGINMIPKDYPVKLFETEKEALKWLKTIE